MTHTMELDRLADLVESWKDNPRRFVEDVFQFEPGEGIIPWQAEAMELIREVDRVAIRSGKGVGKTAMLAWLILWFLATRYEAKVVCTATSGHQLYDVLWAECGVWIRRIRPELRALLVFDVGKDHISMEGLKGVNFAVARTSRREQPEALQGFHARNMLLVVDEASGVPDEVFEVGEGTMSSAGAKTIMTGNPTRGSGYFYDAFHKDRKRWATMRVGCESSPMVTQKHIDDMREKWGERSSEYRVAILGEFPAAEADSIIPRWMVEDAAGTGVTDPLAELVWGVDVARSSNGDRTVVAERRGRCMPSKCWSWRTDDLMDSCGRIADRYYALPVGDRPVRVVVDIIGYGAGVYDRLKELKLPVVSCNVGSSKGVRPGYVRIRDDLWFKGREWFESGEVGIAYDEEFIQEISGVPYKFTSDMKRYVDDKKETLGFSPDLADAFLLTFYGERVRRDDMGNVARRQRQVYAVMDVSHIGG